MNVGLEKIPHTCMADDTNSCPAFCTWIILDESPQEEYEKYQMKAGNYPASSDVFL
jgi:hypothetical protein